MYQKEYYIPKHTGTYAETLEAYGLAALLAEIFRLNKESFENLPKVQITDADAFYVVSAKTDITEVMVSKIKYFELFKYIKVEKDKSEDLPAGYVDYKSQKEKRDTYRKYSDEQYKLRKANKITQSDLERNLNDYQDLPSSDYDIYSKMASPNLISCYREVYLKAKKDIEFQFFIKEVLSRYSKLAKNGESVLPTNLDEKNKKELKKWLSEQVTALQLISPTQAKGLSSETLRLNAVSPKISWLSQYLRIAGCYYAMIPKAVEVSKQTWDTKIYVIEPKTFAFDSLSNLYKTFKPTLKGTNTLKLDIVCLLQYCIGFIENSEEYKSKTYITRWKPINYVAGFHLAYQKNLGQNNGITNICFLSLPSFIEINNYEEATMWLAILNEHLGIIESLDEKNSSVTALLLHYRQFVSSSQPNNFFEFNLDYNGFLMQQLGRGNRFQKPFSHNLLKQLFMATVEKKLTPVLESEGFLSLAKAIRNSTINAQIAKGNGVKGRQYGLDVRYGLSQDVKRKSLRKSDFVSFIMEFCADYERQLARNAENGHMKFQSLRTNEIQDFIKMLDDYDDYVETIAKMLVAYGYALEEKKEPTI